MAFFDEAYVTHLIILVAGFCAAALVTFLWLFCFYCIRCCCTSKCCPQCFQSCAHCLCGGKPKDHYSDNYKRFFFFGTITLALLIFIFVVIGFSGNTQVSTGVNDLTGNVIKTVDDIYNRTDYAYNETRNLKGAASSLATQFQDLRNTMADVRSQGIKVRGEVVHYDSVRRGVMGVGFALPLFGIFFAVIGLVFAQKGFQYLLVFFVGISLVFFWLSLAIHVPVRRVSTDACTEADRYLNDPSLIGDDVDFLVSCLKNGTYFGPIQDTLDEVQNRMTQLKNDAAQQGVNISDALPQTGATVEDQVFAVADFVRGQLTKLSDALDGQPATPEVQELHDEIDNTIIFVNIAEDLAGLARCDYILALLKQIKSNFCDETVGGASLIISALSALIPLVILAGYFVLALFLIRFPDQAKAYYELQIGYPQDPAPVGLVVTQVSGQPMSEGQMSEGRPMSESKTSVDGGGAGVEGGSGGSDTDGMVTGTEGGAVGGGVNGITMSCYSCQTLFAVAPGTPSGTVVACPKCGSHNQLP